MWKRVVNTSINTLNIIQTVTTVRMYNKNCAIYVQASVRCYMLLWINMKFITSYPMYRNKSNCYKLLCSVVCNKISVMGNSLALLYKHTCTEIHFTAKCLSWVILWYYYINTHVQKYILLPLNKSNILNVYKIYTLQAHISILKINIAG